MLREVNKNPAKKIFDSISSILDISKMLTSFTFSNLWLF